MSFIAIAEAKRQLADISDAIDEPLVLIGGLAVNQYVLTRESQDIDLICDYDTSKAFLSKLYPTSEWRHKDENSNEYRPAYSISNKLKSNYPKILIGPKITERGSYKYLDWEKLKEGAIAFEFEGRKLENILVPSVESLCFTKFVSFMGRDLSQTTKIAQDLQDIQDLSNDDSFKLGPFLYLILGSGFDQELGKKFLMRLGKTGGSIKGSNIGRLISLLSPEDRPEGAATSYFQPRPQNVQATGSVQLAAFDLDGTLIKGIRHGWTMVWNILKGPGDTELQEKQKRRKKRFQEGEISYLDWCREDGESCRELGLTRDHFKKLGGINHVSLTKNLREGLRKLRERGIKTAIISGGIDALLYELLPDADDLFDDILINQFIFSEDGIFEYISATEYDWDDSKVGVVGKRRGLERLCEKHGVAISDSAFVGDDLNDIEAMRAAGLKIFYCGDTREFRDSKNTALPRNISIIPSNDFMRVVERILSKKAIDEV